MSVYLKPERILVRFLHIDSKDSYTKKAQRSRNLEPRSEMQGRTRWPHPHASHRGGPGCVNCIREEVTVDLGYEVNTCIHVFKYMY